NVVTTYGSAETAGGCVYSGVALPGVRLRVVPEDAGLADSPVVAGAEAAGRIWLGGEHLASGYLGDSARTASHFFVDAHGRRWYRTDDYGSLTPPAPNTPEDGGAPALSVLGRSDDVIITGGVKVSSHAVAAVLESHPAVREAAVAGVPDARWGAAVIAAVTLRNLPEHYGADAAETARQLQQLCGARLGAAGVPKVVRIVPDFPAASTGKPDRLAIYSMLCKAHAEQQTNRV
ncbi:AMP-binding enzyme, partial [Rothia aeria]|uniref:AMP-binding enzyme n=1 Tax=Rothia aeria TaxID=172042 RepID=UPI003C7B3ADC